MRTYYPDTWVIIKFTSPENTTYKVFGGWYGGYAKGDSWQLNSGIDYVKVDDNSYYFHGFSGSVYDCNKNSENRLTMYHESIISDYRKAVDEEDGWTMEIISSDSPEFVSLVKGM